jgi:hypothetical protein
MREAGERRSGGTGFVAAAGLAAALLALSAEMAAALGSRAGWWDFRAGFAGLRGGAYLGAGAVLLSAAILARASGFRGRKGGAMSVAAIVLGLLAVALPGCYLWTAKHLPMIHDVTTDTLDPPAFVALLETRKASPNGAVYGGPEVAEKQRAAYPDIRSIESPLPAAEAFRKAEAAARGLGWRIADSDAAAGRIEATDTTRWFGFKDDVVIRVRPGPGGQGSRIDLRSVSRVGKSDIGKNASRIRSFFREFGAPGR